jgi:hypothetical protein
VRIWTAQVSAFRSTVCIGFWTPPSVLPLMEGWGPEWNFTLAGPLFVCGMNILVLSPHRLPCVPFSQSPLPQHLPPFVVSCPFTIPYRHLQHPHRVCHIFHLSSRESFCWSKWPLEKTSMSPKGKVDQSHS